MTNKEKMNLANILVGMEVSIFDNDTRKTHIEKVTKVNDCSFITENGHNFKPSKFYSDGGKTFKCGTMYIELY